MEKNAKKSTRNATLLRRSGLAAALLLSAVSLSACVVAGDRGYHEGWRHHNQDDHDGNWNGGAGWQGNNNGQNNGGGSWNHNH